MVKSPQLLWSSSMGPNAVLLSSATRPWAGWSSGEDVSELGALPGLKHMLSSFGGMQLIGNLILLTPDLGNIRIPWEVGQSFHLQRG